MPGNAAAALAAARVLRNFLRSWIKRGSSIRVQRFHCAECVWRDGCSRLAASRSKYNARFWSRRLKNGRELGDRGLARDLRAAIRYKKFSDAWVVRVQVILKGNFLQASAGKCGEFLAR